MEEPADIELAMRFTLSQPAVVTGIPPSFLDLLDRTIEAAIAKLKEMAANQGSIFLREEQMVALNQTPWSPYPHSPHECA